MDDVSRLLEQAVLGDRAALDQVFEQVYPALRALAVRQGAGAEQTMTPTVLVHEVYLKLLGSDQLDIEGRRHFFALAARAMRQIVVDHARRRIAAKRGGPQSDVTLTAALPIAAADETSWLDLDAALDELDAVAPRMRAIVELHFFAGVAFDEVATLLKISPRTVYREWQGARAWLHDAVGGMP